MQLLVYVLNSIIVCAYQDYYYDILSPACIVSILKGITYQMYVQLYSFVFNLYFKTVRVNLPIIIDIIILLNTKVTT